MARTESFVRLAFAMQVLGASARALVGPLPVYGDGPQALVPCYGDYGGYGAGYSSYGGAYAYGYSCSYGYGYGYAGHGGPVPPPALPELPTASPVPSPAATLPKGPFADLQELFRMRPDTSAVAELVEYALEDAIVGRYVNAVLSIPFTILLPNNAAFEEWMVRHNTTMPQLQREWKGIEWAAAVAPMLVPNRAHNSSALTPGFTFTTGLSLFKLPGVTASVSLDPQGAITLTSGKGVPAHVLDKDLFVGKGVVHVVDEAFEPNG